jgi:hypothetical protein
MSTFHLPRLHSDEHPWLRSLARLFWALCGALVLLFIFVAALGALEPSESLELTVVMIALAALWLAHAWRDLWREEHRD